MWETEYYALPNGIQPVKAFLDSLSVEEQVRVLDKLLLLANLGNRSRAPLSKHLDGDIFELRVSVGRGKVRVLYFFTIQQRIVFTNGFIKKTARTPREEIRKAKLYRADYLRRMNKG